MNTRPNRKHLLVITVFLLGFGYVSALGDIIYVNANGTGDYPTIQDAINAANDGDVIEMQPGIYTGDGNRDIEVKGVDDITIRSIDPNDSNIVSTTIIDCDGTESEYHRAFYTYSDGPFFRPSNFIVDGLTITNGYHSEGGAVSGNDSTTVKNCRIVNNAASFGGGIFQCGFVENCTISHH